MHLHPHSESWISPGPDSGFFDQLYSVLLNHIYLGKRRKNTHPQIIYQYYPATRNLRMSLVQQWDSPGLEITHTEHFFDMELFEGLS